MKRYKNDDDRPFFKRGEPVEVTRDFIENIGDPDFPPYGWIVKKSRPLMSDPGYEYLIERDPEFAADDGYDKSYWVYDNEIRRGRYNEGFMSNMGKDGQRLYSIIYRDDGWDGSVQEYGKTEEDAIQAAIAKGKLDGDEDIVKIVDLGEKGEYLKSSRKLVKEGAGAGYTVEIKNLKIGDLIGFEWKEEKNGEGEYVEAKFKIIPGTYEIGASDYYNDFFWQEHEIGVTPDAMIDGGVVTVEYNPDYYRKDYEDPDFKDYDGRGLDIERELQRQIKGEYDISFSYGHGWVHADLPDTMDLTDVDINGRDIYWMITRLQLEAGDLADAVNGGFQSTFDQGEDAEEDEDGEPVNEVSGWKLEDEDLTLVNTERDGDKLYIVKLWWGSGYQLDCYNAYAFSDEEALNYVVAYIEKTDPKSLEAIDENANDYLQELVDEGEAASIEEAYEHPYF